MKRLLYIGEFHPWTDEHDDTLAEALETFDKVTICVALKKDKPLKGQPSKVLESELKNRINILCFKKLSNLLHIKNDHKYVMFDGGKLCGR